MLTHRDGQHIYLLLEIGVCTKEPERSGDRGFFP